MRERALAKTAFWVVLVHFILNLAHGWAHDDKSVPITTLMYLFIIPVILIGPLLAWGLIWTKKEKAGYALLALSMAGSFFFGLAFHFMIQGPDHVSHVQGGLGASMFFWTSLGLALTEGAGALLGGWGLLQHLNPDGGRTANAAV